MLDETLQDDVDTLKWRVALLDDNLQELTEFRATLKERQVEVFSCGDPEAFLHPDTIDALSACHIALIDMQWLGFALAPEVRQDGEPEAAEERFQHAELPAPLNDGAKPEAIHAFVQKWIQTLRRWSHEAAPLQRRNPDAWPRTGIDAAEIGIWLGAMVSHVNPGCELVFYSGAQTAGVDVGTDSYLAPLGRFRHARFQVFRKSNVGATSFLDVLQALRRVQARWIIDDPRFRRWYVGLVLVPTLLNCQPLDDELTEPLPFGRRVVRLNCETLFPQLVDCPDTAGKAAFLGGFLGAPSLVPRHRQALQDVVHSLRYDKRVILQTMPLQAVQQYISDRYASCFQAGDVGQSLIEGLSIARAASSTEEAIGHLQQVWGDAYSRLLNAHCAIQDLCTQYGGSAELSDSSWPTLEVLPEEYPQPHFRANMGELRAIYSALSANAAEHGANNARALCARETDVSVELKWLDASVGFASLGEFQKAAVDSAARKGSDRGLPGAFAAALRLGAKEIEVLTGAPRQWHQVFPVPSIGAAEPSWGFGLKLRFPKA